MILRAMLAGNSVQPCQIGRGVETRQRTAPGPSGCGWAMGQSPNPPICESDEGDEYPDYYWNQRVPMDWCWQNAAEHWWSSSILGARWQSTHGRRSNNDVTRSNKGLNRPNTNEWEDNKSRVLLKIYKADIGDIASEHFLGRSTIRLKLKRAPVRRNIMKKFEVHHTEEGSALIQLRNRFQLLEVEEPIREAEKVERKCEVMEEAYTKTADDLLDIRRRKTSHG